LFVKFSLREMKTKVLKNFQEREREEVLMKITRQYCLSRTRVVASREVACASK